ncbi:MAG: hypothetical protein C0519_13535 [Hyphomicrobium sp.]|nr:hypothetical protein [Hyphomicrobium sp.]PPD08204.1 MAG: hypothetical protein CTY28_05105 [Hyphomicrobium sp.]
MKHSKSWTAHLSLALGTALVASAADAHPLCPDATADACAVYDTGRTTGATAFERVGPKDSLRKSIPAIAASEIVILGEAHDNPHHHKLRAGLLTKPAIAMEQLRADQNAGLKSFAEYQAKSARLATINDFKTKVDWKSGGWDQYPYDPLLEAILKLSLPIYAGDPPRDTIRKIAKEGLGVLSTDDQKRLALDQPLGAKLDAVSAEEIEASHCGMLPKSAIPKMALAQRYRDAHLADATLKAAADHGQAVLLTGNNHARTDRGVPWYIRARAPDKEVVSIILVEVEEGKTDPEAYVPRDPDGKPAADYVIFTPTITRDDPCKAFGK